MKRLLQVGFALGLVGTIAVAYAFPWFEYERYLSKTSVVANGGRVEQFMVHLPADQIESTIEVPGSESGQRLSHFKLRDAEGNVIGLAAKHELSIDGARETAWLLTIPSRGTIAFAGWSPVLGSIESMAADRGLVPGQGADPGLSIDFGAPAQSVVTTGEFEGISFELVETWQVTGIDEEGRIRGTLQLNTIGTQSS